MAYVRANQMPLLVIVRAMNNLGALLLQQRQRAW